MRTIRTTCTIVLTMLAFAACSTFKQLYDTEGPPLVFPAIASQGNTRQSIAADATAIQTMLAGRIPAISTTARHQRFWDATLTTLTALVGAAGSFVPTTFRRDTQKARVAQAGTVTTTFLASFAAYHKYGERVQQSQTCAREINKQSARLGMYAASAFSDSTKVPTDTLLARYLHDREDLIQSIQAVCPVTGVGVDHG